jgi:hypothetical protein
LRGGWVFCGGLRGHDLSRLLLSLADIDRQGA